MRKPMPLWIAEVRKQLAIAGKTQKDLAEEIGLSYQYVRSLLSGSQQSESVQRKICDHLGISIKQINTEEMKREGRI